MCQVSTFIRCVSKVSHAENVWVVLRTSGQSLDRPRYAAMLARGKFLCMLVILMAMPMAMDTETVAILADTYHK